VVYHGLARPSAWEGQQVGFIIAAASGELERGISPLVIFGGVAGPVLSWVG